MHTWINQHRGYRHPFLVGKRYLGGVGDIPRTLVEQALCQFSAELRRKHEWWNQYTDPNVRSQWAEDALQRVWTIYTSSNYTYIELTKPQIEYVLDELSGYDALRDSVNNCQVSCCDRIWESDSPLNIPQAVAVNQDISKFREASAATYTRSEDGVTTVLVDPFLHCLIYKKTLVHGLSRSGPPSALDPPPGDDSYSFSQHSALLPTDFSVLHDGSVKALSYINNIDPVHTSLYNSVEIVLHKVLPLFEHVLTDLHRNNPLPQRIRGSYGYLEWNEPDSPEYSDDEDGWATYQHEVRHWAMHRPLLLPDVPKSGYPGGLEHRRHSVSLRGRSLQIVVNISEIRLHPGGPGYSGSPWHVEGMENERIVACAFYYASVENIAESKLEFRMAVTSPRGFSAGDLGATVRTWGLRHSDPCCQQHRHTPFCLQDPTRPGHQTVIALFLVDPEIQPIVSTARVPPQQHDWIRNAMETYADPRFPSELIEKIVEDVDSIMNDDEAERFREEVVMERTSFWQLNDDYHFCVPFDLWNELN